jgi:spermidine synthase
MARTLLALALLSGAAGLVYEVVWLRWFRLLFGSSAYAASATLCAFFAGLALGSALFGRLAGRTRRPLVWYARLELAAAAAALLVPLALRGYEPIYGALYAGFADSRGLFVAIKLALALAAMLPCAVLLGGSLPLLASAGVRAGGSLGREGNALYATNLLGGAAGAALGGLLLPEWIGVPGTYGVGLALSATAGSGALLLARRRASSPAGRPAYASAPPERDGPPALAGPAREAPAASGGDRAPARALAIAFASGFGVLAFQVLLIQSLGHFFAHTAYSFGSVLVVVLLCLVAGAALASASEGRLRVGPLLGGALLSEAWLLALLPWVAAQGQAVLQQGGASLGGRSALAVGTLTIAALGVPALLVAALVFPLTLRLAAGGPVGPRLGGLLAANTLGAIAGSLAASFVLLPVLGLWPAIAVLGLAYGAAALFVVEGRGGRIASAVLLAGLAALLVATPASPWRLPPVPLAPGERLLAVESGAQGTAAVVEGTDGNRMIKLDGHYAFGGTGEKRLSERMGHLPLLLHPDPKRVLVVGSATGGLAAAAVLHPVTSIHLVEIVPEVQELAAAYFADSNRHVHTDPRTRLIVEDGRNHLRGADERYDVIVEDLFVPHRPSAAAMYSLDHYRDVRAHLAEGGVFCQWLALYQMTGTELAIVARTFAEAFPDATLWRPHFRAQLPILGLVGMAGPLPSAAAVADRARALAGLVPDDAWVTDPAGIWLFYLGPLSALVSRLPAIALHTDARPLFEFVASRATPRMRASFAYRDWPRLAAALAAGAGERDAAFPGRPLAGPRGGEALARLNLAAAAGGPRAASAAAEVRRDVPARLLATRDRSVSEVWPAEAP